ncbi:MAG: hypothetical protein HN855_08185 [Anaerolineae bacterium]|jgi:hypothetical protein|nr:hypothetical protein [Anaerolineae bacterium]MBT7069476.1 hypothetical protein [Anaerolineae bacterium]MBT7325121.1 hypothetical protein [Anaerolineae bacterium]
MKRFDMRIVFGLVLIGTGALFLLENLGIFHGGIDLMGAAILGGAGLTFLYVYSINRSNWWALIPGTTLLAISLNILIAQLFPALSNIIGGGIILGGIGLSFWIIFLTHRSFWWAIIPAGVLSSLAIVSVLDEIIPGGKTDGLFLVGLGMTFILIALLPGYENNLKWAYIPGGILTLIGILTLPFLNNIFNILWPLAFVGAGGYIIYKNFKN